MTGDEQDRLLHKKRLYWRCRRGLLELDELLQSFLDRGYDSLDIPGRQAFDTLMACPDTELQEILLGRVQLEDSTVQGVVDAIRESYHS